MENKKQASGSSSSSSKTLDHLFGPKDSMASSQHSSGIFGSIFPPSSVGLDRERMPDSGNQVATSKYEYPDNIAKSSKGESSVGVGSKEMGSAYQNETAEPSYLSSSIYYGGQENYSPRTRPAEPRHPVNKDGSDDNANGGSASRGNWWEGSLYY